MTLPIVSIITPTYNHEKYIQQCIASVQHQDFSNWEMIILNDGSTDNTASITQQCALNDHRIQVVNQPNVGVFKLADTYNKGLHLSKGKYIAILEGDDLWEHHKLARQVEIMEKDPTIILSWGKAELVNENLSVSYYTSPNQENIPVKLLHNTPPGSIIELSMFGAWIPALTMVIRKESLIRAGGFIQAHGMPLVDFPTILTLSRQGIFHFENDVLGKWRIYPTQTTKKYTVEIYNGMVAFLREHLPSVYPSDTEKQMQIIEHYSQLCLIAYARSGRYKLIRKEFKSARIDYVKAMAYPINGEWIWRLRALIGYGMSLFHLDVEWLAKLLGKQTYKG